MLEVHVQPRARRAGLQGFRADGALKLGVTAPPEDGRANVAVTILLADVLEIARSRVRVVRGSASRSKTIEIEGLSGDEIRRRLEGAARGD